MADSSAQMQSLKYLYASNVNVSNFVSEKLSSDDNYPLWKAQMLCLMECHEMRGMVDMLYDDPGAINLKTVKKYDSLLKGWIFGSLTPSVLRTVVDLESARDVWWKLQSIYRKEKSSAQVSASQKLLNQLNPPGPVTEFTHFKDPMVTEPESIDTTSKKKLFKATVEGRWWEAESILKNAKQAATEAITDNGNTMLHLAVRTGQNDFVIELLDFIDDAEKIEKKNSDGRTVLHIAAIVGNTHAAILLVHKRKQLLGIPDHKALVPLLSAYYNMKVDTYAYLLKVTGQSPPLAFSLGQPGVNFLITLIFMKKYDLATTEVNKYPELVTRDDEVLMAMVKTFPSDLGFGEALFYPSLDNVCQKLIKRCSLLFHSYDFLYAKAKDILWEKRRSVNTIYSWLFPKMVIILLVPAAMFYPIYQLIRLLILVLFYPLFVLYFLLWKGLATVGK